MYVLKQKSCFSKLPENQRGKMRRRIFPFLVQGLRVKAKKSRKGHDKKISKRYQWKIENKFGRRRQN
jgi:hypothetical protein